MDERWLMVLTVTAVFAAGYYLPYVIGWLYRRWQNGKKD